MKQRWMWVVLGIVAIAILEFAGLAPLPGRQNDALALHRSLDGRRIVSYVQRESRELLHAAHQSPEFRKEWSRFDGLTDGIDPHLYEISRVKAGGT